MDTGFQIKIFIIISLVFLCGCTVKAKKGNEEMILRGWGAKEAVFSDGSKISKEEPIRIPNVVPLAE